MNAVEDCNCVECVFVYRCGGVMVWTRIGGSVTLCLFAAVGNRVGGIHRG